MKKKISKSTVMVNFGELKSARVLYIFWNIENGHNFCLGVKKNIYILWERERSTYTLFKITYLITRLLILNCKHCTTYKLLLDLRIEPQKLETAASPHQKRRFRILIQVFWLDLNPNPIFFWKVRIRFRSISDICI